MMFQEKLDKTVKESGIEFGDKSVFKYIKNPTSANYYQLIIYPKGITKHYFRSYIKPFPNCCGAYIIYGFMFTRKFDQFDEHEEFLQDVNKFLIKLLKTHKKGMLVAFDKEDRYGPFLELMGFKSGRGFRNPVHAHKTEPKLYTLVGDGCEL